MYNLDIHQHTMPLKSKMLLWLLLFYCIRKEGLHFMKMKNNFKYLTGFIFSFILCCLIAGNADVFAATSISYTFEGNDKDKAGYAEGTVTISSDESATFHLFWADDNAALPRYYEIDSKLEEEKNLRLKGKKLTSKGFSVSSGKNATFKFQSHVAIPAGATKLIAVKDINHKNVSDASAVFDIPKEKQLYYVSGKRLYTFSSYSDVHIDKNGFYTNSSNNWLHALNFSEDLNTDFICSSGDEITNANSLYKSEYESYASILKKSRYTGKIWETNGNHDLRSGGKDSTGTYYGNNEFTKTSGTDSTAANYKALKPYYYMIEEKTGDLFIFMALEDWTQKDSSGNKTEPSSYFSDAQMKWLQDLLDTYYGTGINIYITEHCTIKNFSTGDNWDNPLYGGHLKESKVSAFKSILEKYKDLIWMNGHSHQDFYLNNNYSNRNGSACNMIHNPSVAGTSYDNNKDSSQQYNSPEASGSDGKGLNSQGYYTEVFENEVIYNGVDINGEAIYPEYCYIMEGSRNSEPIAAVRNNIIQPEYEVFQAAKELLNLDATIEQAQIVGNAFLNAYGKYASFDQYQAVKRLLRDPQNIDVASLKEACESGYAFLVKIGAPSNFNVVTGGKYYFENTDWDTAYVYAYNSSSDCNAKWPGVKLDKAAGTGSSGKTVYEFDSGNYQNVVFNNGNNGKQTVDIALGDYSDNCFKIDTSKVTTKNSNKVYDVKNYNFSK